MVSDQHLAYKVSRNKPRASQLVRLIVLGGLLLILYTTLFPFDFVSRENNLLGEVGRRFDFSLVKPDAPFDFFRNIILFLPIGFGISYQAQKKERGKIWCLLTALILGFSLSLAVELLQVFLPGRDPSLSDILANTFGSFVGYLCFYFWGNSIIDYLVDDLVGKVKAQLSLTRLTAVFIGYAFFFLIVSIYLQSQTRLNNWDSTYPLMLGNEQTGDRPWQGYISEIDMTNRALSEEKVKLAFSEKRTVASVMAPLLISYQLNGQVRYRDQAGLSPDLSWQGVDVPDPNETAAFLTPRQWLETTAPVTRLTDKLRETSQLTINAVIASASTEQEGPARIISISADPFRRNFTLGQEKADLIIRLRTPLTGENGREPELAVPNVFLEPGLHHLVISYDGSNLRLYVDGLQQSYLFKLTPEVMFFRYFLPISPWRIYLGPITMWFYTLLYYSLIFVPLGLLLGLMVTLAEGSFLRVILILGGVLLPPLVLEYSLAGVSGNGVRLENLLLSVIIVAGTFLMTRIQITGLLRSKAPMPM